MAIEEKLNIIRETPSRYHFRTKDDQLVDIEYKEEHLFVSLFKWGTEASLLIDLNAVLSTEHRFLEAENKIEIENPDFLLRIYPIDTRSTEDFYEDTEDYIQCHDGGLRFEFVLKKKRPAMNNAFTFPIISKNLRFSYQTPLTPEQIDQGHRRPLNVEGSYAVYHVNRKNKQYMTGKAFHLYRPIAEDALGAKAWCSIEIDKPTDSTVLTFTIPQQFLDEATYPITIDPDFGYSIIGGSWRSIANEPQDIRMGSAWTMPANGTVNWIRAYIYGDETCNVKAIINQKDSGGANTHGEIAGPVENLNCAMAAHWEEFTFAGEVLTAAIVYILNVIGEDLAGKGNIYYVAYDTNGAVDSYYLDIDAFRYPNPTDPWVRAPEGTTLDHSIYANYDVIVPPPPPPPPQTKIGTITINIPSRYRYNQYNVDLAGAVDTDELLHSLRELFAKARAKTAVHDIPGSRPRGEDMTEELRNTQYIQFAHGDRPITGWYLLREFYMFQDETPEGSDMGSYLFAVAVFFLGTEAFYQAGYHALDLDSLESDWSI